MFYKLSKSSQLNISERSQDEDFLLQQEINLDTLKLYLEKEFPERGKGDNKDYSELVNELKKAGYKTIREIQQGIEIGYDPKTFLQPYFQ